MKPGRSSERTYVARGITITRKGRAILAKLDAKDPRMAQWCKRNARHAEVRAWLKDNPPPSAWRGTPLEYAYTEMPLGPP